MNELSYFSALTLLVQCSCVHYAKPPLAHSSCQSILNLSFKVSDFFLYTPPMRLQSLQLQNFRNYEQLNLDFTESDVLALIGPNAQGKTNLLESIAFLALGKSFRTRQTMETLKWDAPYGRIRGTLTDSAAKQVQLEVFLQREPEAKKFKRQDALCNPKEFLGHLQVVVFTPDHLNLIYGSPKIRRQYLDRLLLQLDKNYLDAINNYQKILRHRNALLKKLQFGRGEDWELELWDARLVTEAETVWQKRTQLIASMQENLAQHYQTLARPPESAPSKTKPQLTLHYKPQTDRFEERLGACRQQDLRTGSTSIGPHRDDFMIHLNKREIDEFGSRGECRSAVLALKIAEMQVFQERLQTKPLLLLDDVFSELDAQRQKQLGELIQGYQCVITTTAKEHLKGLKNAKVLHLDGGGIVS
jgi:DNA replication and repair protein RecF